MTACNKGDSTVTCQKDNCEHQTINCDWSPESEIQLFMGVYYMDGDFISGMVNDPAILLDCDDARFRPLALGGFEVVNADDGELLYELGLRNGDKPLELNGLPLDTFEDGAVAFGELYGESTFELYLLRGTAYVTLDYFVTYSL